MAETNRRFLLRERPAERCVDETFERVEEAVPDISDDEALLGGSIHDLGFAISCQEQTLLRVFTTFGFANTSRRAAACGY